MSDTIRVKVPFKAGRLDAPPKKVFKNKKAYTRKQKHKEKFGAHETS